MKRVGMLFQGAFAVVCAFGVLTVVGSRPAAAQSGLQSNVVTGLSCAPSQNGTGHMICGEELGGKLFGGTSWQGNFTTTGAPGTEAPFTVHAMSAGLPASSGPFTASPGCSQTADGSGAVICAVQGPSNGLYGIAIHPQPTQTTSAFLPLLLPGTVINTGSLQVSSPCSNAFPCNIVSSIAGTPSCVQTSAPGKAVICAVVASMQNTLGAAQPQLIGVAFDPRQAAAAGTNPAIAALPYTPTYASNPSCVGVTDHTGGQNAGSTFAACGVAVMNTAPWSTATIFGVAFDPRSGYSRGGLIINSSASFVGDPSCAAPRDGSTEVLCAIGTNGVAPFNSGTFTTMNGFGFDPVNRTTTAFQPLETASGFAWKAMSCASPNVAASPNTTLCALTTTANQTFGVRFDPRVAGSALVTPGGSVFTPPTGAAIKTAPSCISLNIVANSISCGIVDSANQSWAFAVPSP